MQNQNSIRDPDLLRGLTNRLASLRLASPVTLMEVCGTHTMAIHRGGIPHILPPTLRLLSGPGCPVCVTPVDYLDRAMETARKYGVTLATFGDMMRVPGSRTTLTDLRAEGYPVEIVYSPLQALETAREHPGREVVFLGVGFETTAPAVAATLQKARASGLKNFSVLAAHKRVIPALELLVSDDDIRVDGFILPGHVSAVIGSEPYRFLAERHGRACAITGFETADIVQGILMLADQIEGKAFTVANQYSRVVKPNGNERALGAIDAVFETADTTWRGFGVIPASGMVIREEFAGLDAEKRFPVDLPPSIEPAGCRCGEVLTGHIDPTDCPLFGNPCSPHHPAGACMVSSEGTCAAFHRYVRRESRPS